MVRGAGLWNMNIRIWRLVPPQATQVFACMLRARWKNLVWHLEVPCLEELFMSCQLCSRFRGSEFDWMRWVPSLPVTQGLQLKLLRKPKISSAPALQKTTAFETRLFKDVLHWCGVLQEHFIQIFQSAPTFRNSVEGFLLFIFLRV